MFFINDGSTNFTFRNTVEKETFCNGFGSNIYTHIFTTAHQTAPSMDQTSAVYISHCSCYLQEVMVSLVLIKKTSFSNFIPIQFMILRQLDRRPRVTCLMELPGKQNAFILSAWRKRALHLFFRLFYYIFKCVFQGGPFLALMKRISAPSL